MINKYEEDEIATLAINHISKSYSKKIFNDLKSSLVYHLIKKRNKILQELLSDYEKIEILINNSLLQGKEKKALRLLAIQNKIRIKIEKIVKL